MSNMYLFNLHFPDFRLVIFTAYLFFTHFKKISVYYFFGIIFNVQLFYLLLAVFGISCLQEFQCVDKFDDALVQLPKMILPNCVDSFA